MVCVEVGVMSLRLDAFRQETVVAIGAMARALELTQSRVGAEDVTSKGGRDLVTATDIVVEDQVRAIGRQELGASVVGEERGGHAPFDGEP
jgi:fructose-1,6-bisphosphatase/inositol monophosphatase family enzyme